MRKKRLLSIVLAMVLSLAMIAGCGKQAANSGGDAKNAADMILKSSVIYTVASEDPIAGGVAIKDGKILAVGSAEDMEQYTGDETEVVDYGDKMIMPGFVDAHTHSMIEPSVIGVDVTFIADMNDATKACQDWLDEHPDTDFIVGGGWYAPIWGGDDPDKSYLDKVSTDIPISLTDFDHHNRWVNSKVLELAGIDAEFAKKFNEEKGEEMTKVDDKGEPTGYLTERATDLLLDVEPKATEENVLTCINVWSTYGVTTVNDMNPWLPADDIYYDILEKIRDEGKLQVRHTLALHADSSEEDIEKWIKRWNSEDDDFLKFGSLKIMIDGVASTYNASMLQPYKDTDNTGPKLYYEVDELVDRIKKADKYGLATHYHVCGDAAVKQAVDSYEQAAKDGVKLDPRFSVDHCDTTKEEDAKRMGELGISANMTPDFMNVSPDNWDDNVYLNIYDEDTKKELWRCKSFIDYGVNVAFGTDAYCSAYSPFVQMYRAVYRVGDDGKPEGGYDPWEKIDIKQAIKCYTLNSAISAGWDEKVGTLEEGKLADVIVLDTNILDCSQEELFKAGVEKTYLGGKLIYDKEAE